MDNDQRSTLMHHLHNLAPNTFPLSTDRDNSGGSGCATTTADAPMISKMSNVLTETASKVAAVINPYAVQGQSTVLDAVEYIHNASLDMLRYHDKRIPSVLRAMYKILLRENNRVECTKMSIFFNLYIRSNTRLTFYKDAIQLGTSVMASNVPKLIPLNRGVCAVNITMDDVLNDIQWSRNQCNGQLPTAVYENPYLRLARTTILEALREYMGNDLQLFKDAPTYDTTDEILVHKYIDMYLNDNKHDSAVKRGQNSVGAADIDPRDKITTTVTPPPFATLDPAAAESLMTNAGPREIGEAIEQLPDRPITPARSASTSTAATVKSTDSNAYRAQEYPLQDRILPDLVEDRRNMNDSPGFAIFGQRTEMSTNENISDVREQSLREHDKTDDDCYSYLSDNAISSPPSSPSRAAEPPRPKVANKYRRLYRNASDIDEDDDNSMYMEYDSVTNRDIGYDQFLRTDDSDKDMTHERTVQPEVHERMVPQMHIERTVPQMHIERTVPQMHIERTVPEVHERMVPQVHERTASQSFAGGEIPIMYHGISGNQQQKTGRQDNIIAMTSDTCPTISVAMLGGVGTTNRTPFPPSSQPAPAVVSPSGISAAVITPQTAQISQSVTSSVTDVTECNGNAIILNDIPVTDLSDCAANGTSLDMLVLPTDYIGRKKRKRASGDSSSRTFESRKKERRRERRVQSEQRLEKSYDERDEAIEAAEKKRSEEDYSFETELDPCIQYDGQDERKWRGATTTTVSTPEFTGRATTGETTRNDDLSVYLSDADRDEWI